MTQQLQNEVYGLGRVVAQFQLAAEQAAARIQELEQELEAARARIKVLEGSDAASA